MKMLRCISALFVVAFAASAQIPSQYPGQYPPGQYPPGTRGPIPRIPGQTSPTGRPRGGQPQPDSRGKKSDSKAQLVTTTAGILRRVAPNQLVIEPDDHRVVWYRLAPQLTVRKDGKDADLKDFAPGDYLSVDSDSDDDSIMTAVSVTWKKAGTPDDRAEASKTWDLPRPETAARGTATSSPKSNTNSSASSPPREPGDDRPVLRRKDPEPAQQPEAASAPAAPPKQVAAVAPPKEEEPDNSPPPTQMRPPDPKPDDDDPGKPALRRGVPAPRRQTAEESPIQHEIPPTPTVKAPVAEAIKTSPPSVAPAPASQPIPLGDDATITKAREAALAYSATLPNYLVQQMTTRYQSDRPKAGWTALDIVTADLTYQDGRESYKNIKVGNKSVNTSMDEIPGTRSTGEFSTLLEQLFEAGAAKFRPGGQDTIHNRPALVYSFEVTRELSRWRIEAPSQLYYPATKGSVWIDKETSRVLRIEQQGKGMPALFPFDTIETSVDYDFIRLGTSGPYLLPVESEVLSCQRGTSICSRNKIEFRNYRKFGAETNITFDKP
ncbi:MAG: hypothetical protein LAP61_03925 [Acidobacteriia bacterium]|nr:hypothetical protein [Terriglobia bacterium]